MFNPLDVDYPIARSEYDALLGTAWDRCIDTKHLDWYDAILIAGPIFAAMPLAYAVERLCGSLGFSLPGWGLAFIVVVPYIIAVMFGYRRRYRREVLAELRARGHNVCPRCGYFRQGLGDDAPCPECGTKLPETDATPSDRLP